METIGQRLKRLRNARGLSQDQLAKACGYKSQGAIGNIESDARGYGSNVVAIARVLETTPEYLLMDPNAPHLVRDADAAYIANDARITIPLLENSGSMGRGEDELHTDVVVDDLVVSRHWLQQRVHASTLGALRLIHAYGDSMMPTMRDGDILLVDTGQRDPGDVDGIYVLRANKRLYIKRVRQRMTGELEVSSDNPAIKTIDVLNGETAIDVLGRVIWVWNGVGL